MKIIVIGSNSQLAKSLKKINFSKKLEMFYLNKQDLNISDEIQLSNTFKQIKPNIVINCSAYTNVQQAESNFTEANIVNNLSLISLSKISNKYNSLLIHFSTDYVFDGSKNQKYIEEDSGNPLSIYGKSKYEGEKKIIRECDNYIIFRVSWLFSEFNNNFFDFVINNIKNNKNIHAITDLKSIPTYSGEIALFLKYFLENYNYENYTYIYHFNCGGSEISWYDFSMKIFDKYLKSKQSISKIFKTNAYDLFKNNIRPKYSALSNYKFIKKFNYKVNSWENSVEKLLFKKFNNEI